ncbi:MAG: acyl carrier protein [Planctomycetota bacterium]
MPVTTLQELEEGLVEIIRKDLKLDDVEFTLSTSLASEELGFDSLDYLMLITSIEKRFGIKLTSDEMNPETMRDVRKLAAYLHGKVD